MRISHPLRTYLYPSHPATKHMSFTYDAKREERRAALRVIANSTLNAIEQGFYTVTTPTRVVHRIGSKLQESKRRTKYYDPDSLLSSWAAKLTNGAANTNFETEYTILEISTIDGARYLRANAYSSDASNPTAAAPPSAPAFPSSSTSTSNHPPALRRIGVLNFASATKPGGGFINGAQAQEESIARSSTLYPTLTTDASQKFYALHTKDKRDGYYTHAMIYSPGVLIIKDDSGEWLDAGPVEVDVLTSPAVNAGIVRKSLQGRLQPKLTEERIRRVMRSRMGRILYLFEKEGVKDLVLGSFGTGVFQNEIAMVAKTWAELLSVQGARFEKSFDRVVFAILGRETILGFEEAWRDRINPEPIEVDDDNE